MPDPLTRPYPQFLGLFLLLVSIVPAAAALPSREGAYYHFLEAKERERLGQVDEAVGEYDRALKLDPKSVEIRVALAGLMADAHRMAEAMDLLRDALRLDDKSIPARRLLANLLLRLEAEPRGGRYSQEARSAFEELVKLDPEDWDARRTLGEIALDQRDMKAARSQFEMLSRHNPADIESRLHLAQVYAATERFDLAADVYAGLERDMGRLSVRERPAQIMAYIMADRGHEALELATTGVRETGEDSPVHLRYLRLQGVAASSVRFYPQAERSYREVLKLDPGELEARARLALTLQAMGRKEDAEKELTTLKRELEGRSADQGQAISYGMVLERLGMLYLDMGKGSLAIETLGSAIAIADESEKPALQALRCRARFMAGHRDEAIGRLRKLVDETGSEDARMTLLALLYKDGRVRKGWRLVKAMLHGAKDEAARKGILLAVGDILLREKAYQDAERLASKGGKDDVDGLYLLGSAYERQGRFEEAEAVFRKVLRRNPRSARALNYLGYMLVDHDRKLDEAVALLEIAVAFDRHNAAYLDSVGWAYYKTGRLQDALQALRLATQSLANDPVILEHLALTYLKLGRLEEAEEAFRRLQGMGPNDPDRIMRLHEETCQLLAGRS